MGNSTVNPGYKATILIMVLLLTFIYMFVANGFSHIATFDLELKGEDYSGMLVHLFIVAIIVERFIEVYTAIWRKGGRVELENQLRLAQDDQSKSDIKVKIDNYRAQTGMRTMYGAFTIGVVISLAGISTLTVLFNTTELSSMQSNLFRAVDVLITSGIIAGGSKGISKMSSLISEFIVTSRHNVKNARANV